MAARKQGTKVPSLTETTSVPGCACPADNNGIVPACWLAAKYWSSLSTKTGMILGEAQWNRLASSSIVITCMLDQAMSMANFYLSHKVTGCPILLGIMTNDGLL